MKILATILASTILLWATVAESRIDDPEDYSDPALVKEYITMPCDFLDRSYTFQYNELKHLTSHYRTCLAVAKQNPDIKYGEMLCTYLRFEWELMYKHATSIKKAFFLVCNEDGSRKNPEYEIDF